MVAMMWKILLLSLTSCAWASHFRGAIVQWRPINPANFDGRIEISHRIAWRGDSLSPTCMASDIGSRTNLLGGSGSLMCTTGCSASFSLQFYCTDFSADENWVAGSNAVVYNIGTSSTYFEAMYAGGAWITLIVGGGNWEVRVKGNLTRRADNGRVNTSPVTSVTPIVRLRHGCSHRIIIPNQDADQDIVRCRWAEAAQSECAGVCRTFPGATLDEDNCIISYTANRTAGWYAVAIQMEDFISSTSTTPMSSVPIQFLAFVFTDRFSCDTNTAPALVLEGETPVDDSCIPVPSGTTYRAGIVAYSGGSALRVTQFITSSPLGLTRSSVVQSSFNSSIYYMNVTWTPSSNQLGTLQIFCFQARNNLSLESPQSCISFIGGLTAPMALENTTFPVGTILPTASIDWSVTFDQTIRRPTSSRYIRFFEETSGQMVYSLSTISSDVTFAKNGTVMNFTVDFNFTRGQRYFVLLDSGVVVGTLFCLPESKAVRSSMFWSFMAGCLQGYSFLGNSCTDIDECQLGTHSCSLHAECLNTEGSYNCTCLPGTIGNGFNCQDACDECSGTPAGCGSHNCNSTVSYCTNTVGNFTCDCRFGMEAEGHCSPPPQPDPPVLLQVVDRSPNTLTISWQAPAPDLKNNISSYILFFTDQLTGQTSKNMTSSVVYTFSGLEEFHNYSFQVVSVNIFGIISNLSAPLVATTSEAAPSRPPQNVQLSSLSSTSILITWSPPPLADQNGVITGYQINLTEADTGTILNMASTSTSLTATSLHPYYMYEVVVAAVTVAVGPYSIPAQITTLEDTPSGPPANVTVGYVPPSSLKIQWELPELFERNGFIRGYEVTLTYSSKVDRVYNLSGSILGVLIDCLPGFAEVNVSIAAKTIVGVGPSSVPIIIWTNDDVPSPPKDLKVIKLDVSTILLSWSPPTSPNGILVEYKVIYLGYKSSKDMPLDDKDISIEDGPYDLLINYPQTSVQLKAWVSNLTYAFIVSARTSAGYGPNATITVDMSDKQELTSPLGQAKQVSNIIWIILAVLGWLLLLLLLLLFVWWCLRNKERNKNKLPPEQKNLNVHRNSSTSTDVPLMDTPKHSIDSPRIHLTVENPYSNPMRKGSLSASTEILFVDPKDGVSNNNKDLSPDHNMKTSTNTKLLADELEK